MKILCIYVDTNTTYGSDRLRFITQRPSPSIPPDKDATTHPLVLEASCPLDRGVLYALRNFTCPVYECPQGMPIKVIRR